jgi:DDE superfamily endonuclease
LEREGFLAKDLCIFGDLAYVNTSYMATPFKSVRSGTKDDYNFFHSQLRITIECAFGMLVNRWGILRRPLPAKFSLNRALLLVMTLCRLHNYCIDKRIRHKKKGSGSMGSFNIASHLAADSTKIACRGGVPLERRQDRDLPSYVQRLPEQLLHGGEHHQDTERRDRRSKERTARNLAVDGQLPRDILHQVVVSKQLQRPEPNKWHNQKADY